MSSATSGLPVIPSACRYSASLYRRDQQREILPVSGEDPGDDLLVGLELIGLSGT